MARAPASMPWRTSSATALDPCSASTAWVATSSRTSASSSGAASDSSKRYRMGGVASAMQSGPPQEKLRNRRAASSGARLRPELVKHHREEAALPRDLKAAMHRFHVAECVELQAV